MDEMQLNFEKLKEAVLVKKPILRDILEKHGDKSLTRYAEDYFDVNTGPGLEPRQDEFLGTFERQVRRLLGDEVAHSATAQLKKYYFASTADHHGPLCDPYFLNSNLVTAITAMAKKDPVLNNVIVFSCANVSVDNDTFPRGFTFHGLQGNDLAYERLAFFSSHERPPLICHLRPYGTPEIEKIEKAIRDQCRKGTMTENVANTMTGLLKEIYNQPEMLACKSYSDQITKTNHLLWKKFFTQSDATPPNLVYLELEQLVIDLILEHHIDRDTTINRYLCDEAYHELTQKYFDGVTGAFSKADKYGTYLFWAVPPGARYRLQLEKIGNELVSTDGTYRLTLTPEHLRQALLSKEIVPSMLICFLTLACYYGIKCLGGFMQVNYLTDMKHAYISMQQELGNTENVAICEPVQTKELGEDLSVAFLGHNGDMALATGLDLIFYNRQHMWECMVEQAQEITLNEAIGPMFPSFYRVIYMDNQRDPALMALTSRDINKLTKLDQKIHPCVEI